MKLQVDEICHEGKCSDKENAIDLRILMEILCIYSTSHLFLFLFFFVFLGGGGGGGGLGMPTKPT